MRVRFSCPSTACSASRSPAACSPRLRSTTAGSPARSRGTPSADLAAAFDDRRNVVVASTTTELRRWLMSAPAEAFGAPMTFKKKAMKLQIAECRLQIGAAVMLALVAPIAAQLRQTEQDEYAVYELLAPESGSFKTIYEVAVTTPGATVFFDRIGDRLQSIPAGPANDDAVYDLMTGAPLEFEQVTGAQAKASGLADADLAHDYVRVQLARPVPSGGGQARLRIIKTYKDPVSYRRDGAGLLFERSLGIRRGAIVLPAGYQLTDCNVPAQVLSEPDGRIRVSFMQAAPGPAGMILKAKPGALTGEAARPRPLTAARSWEPPPAQGPTERARLAERAHQDRDIAYFLQPPETNAFSLYHDYTESREGVDKYLNVVRTGSTVSDPSAKNLDTGEALEGRILTGAQMNAAGIDPAGEQVAADQQVVVSRFPPIRKGQSIRLRLSETYTAPQSYRLEGDELVFERSLGRPRNSVVLPRGWYLTALSIPAVVRQTPDGLTRIDFVNGRPDSIDVLIKGKKGR